MPVGWHWHFEDRSSVLVGWFRVAFSQSEWVFCLLVPPLTGWLLYRQRKLLKLLPLQGRWWGAVLMVIAFGIYWMGYKVDTGYPAFIAAHLSLAGLIVLIGGLPWMRALFFPWLFLFFMWPLLPLEERLAFPLRMLTAGLASNFLNLIGVDVVREGTAIYSAGDPLTGLVQGDLFRLDVEEPCSGIRSLFSLMMVSALYGYISLKMPVQRLILFASAIPMAVLGNFVRMVMLAVGSLWFGTEFAVGRNIEGHQEMSLFHTLAGYAVFGVALAGMFGLCTLLESGLLKRFIGKPPKKKGPKAVAASYGPGLPPMPLYQRAVLGLAIAMLALVVCGSTDISPVMAQPGVNMNLPLQFAEYQGRELDMTARERNILDVGVELARTYYAAPGGSEFLCTVIVGGEGKRTLHRPEVCLPGQGWTIADTSTMPVDLEDGRTIEVTLLRLFRDAEPEPGKRVRIRGLNIYWYIGSDGTTSPDFYDHIRLSYQHAIFRNLNHRWSMASFFFPMKPMPLGMEDPFAEVARVEEARQIIRHLAPSFEKKEVKTASNP
jgi:exosortase